MINENEITVDEYSHGLGSLSMRLTHMPTGLSCCSKIKDSKRQTYISLLGELEEKLKICRRTEGNEQQT